jgi:hypothetical protein
LASHRNSRANHNRSSYQLQIFPTRLRQRRGCRKRINKNTRKKVEWLIQLAGEWKAEVDKTDSANLFALKLLKEAEEIEKLAHEIRKHSKG